MRRLCARGRLDLPLPLCWRLLRGSLGLFELLLRVGIDVLIWVRTSLRLSLLWGFHYLFAQSRCEVTFFDVPALHESGRGQDVVAENIVGHQ